MNNKEEKKEEKKKKQEKILLNIFLFGICIGSFAVLMYYIFAK